MVALLVVQRARCASVMRPGVDHTGVLLATGAEAKQDDSRMIGGCHLYAQNGRRQAKSTAPAGTVKKSRSMPIARKIKARKSRLYL